MTRDDINGVVSAKDAADALKAVKRAERRTAALGFSAFVGPQLVIWGAVWLICNSVVQFAPAWGPVVWFPGVIVGTGASIFVSRREGSREEGWRKGASFLVLVAFMNAVAIGLGLHDSGQFNFFISLIVACGYLEVGIWKSRGLAIAGALLFLLTILGWWEERAWFALWMGVVGGGTLIATGLWLRSV